MADVVILGAGIAGLSAGWLLKQQGIDFVVLEKQAYVGGLARSFNWHGFPCDFAAHRLFTTNEDILQQLLNLVPMGRHIRRSQIYLQGNWMRDPLDVIELGLKLSFGERLGILWTYLTRQKNLPDDCFMNYVIRRYGKSLYRLFFKPYTEKLFGIPGDDISVLWARQKVRLSNPLDNIRENSKTKFQYFYYPIREGYGAIANRLYTEIQEHVLLDTQVKGLEVNGNKIENVLYQKDEQQVNLPVRELISTLPMSITARMLGHNLELKFQKVEAVYIHVNRPLLTDNHWIYFVDDDVAINRMVEFKNMSSVDVPKDTTVLCAEVTQNHSDPAEKVVSDLVKVGLLQSEEVLDTKVVRENFSYPVYNKSYDKALENAQSTFGQYTNLQLVGRAAEFRHREVDDNFAAAKEAVEHILKQIPAAIPVKEKREILMPEKEVVSPIYIVVLTYNHYEETYECLKSLFESNNKDFKVVLVDNGSEDGTPEQVRRDFPTVGVIENGQNLGVPAGYNIGFLNALEAGAEYILMLNNDTILHPDMLDELLTVANADPKAGIVMPKILYHSKPDQVWSSGGRYRKFPPAILMNNPRQGVADTNRIIEFAPSCGLLIHRRAFEKVGLFDPGYFFMYDDWDFSERVRTHGLNIWYAANAKLWHKVSTTTRGPRSPLFWRTYASSIVRYWRRHGRPVWLSLPMHLGYIVARDFLWKRNWAYWNDFWQGVREGLQKPLSSLPQTNSIQPATSPPAQDALEEKHG